MSDNSCAQDPKGINEEAVLPDGTVLKKGGMISYSPYCMARMPYIWGPDAKEFKPERWLRDGKFYPESEFKFATFQVLRFLCLHASVKILVHDHS